MIKDAYGNTRFFGTYRAVVVDNVDPLNKGRVKLRIPQVLANEVTDWAWFVNTPGNIFVAPSVGEGVWAQFEGGDPSYPIWLGVFNQTSQATPVVSTNSTDLLTPTPAEVRWSPVFQATGLTFTGTGATYPTYNSYYVRYGQLVTFNIKIDLNTVTNFGTGQFKVDLPFAPISSAANHFSAWSWVDPSQPADELNGHKQLVADHIPGSQTLDFHWLKETTASPKPLIESILVQGTPVTFTTASKMYVNGTYICAP
jgi:hypothetical protein